jgi:hypothetical protein
MEETSESMDRLGRNETPKLLIIVRRDDCNIDEIVGEDLLRRLQEKYGGNLSQLSKEAPQQAYVGATTANSRFTRMCTRL